MYTQVKSVFFAQLIGFLVQGFNAWSLKKKILYETVFQGFSQTTLTIYSFHLDKMKIDRRRKQLLFLQKMLSLNLIIWFTLTIEIMDCTRDVATVELSYEQNILSPNRIAER